MKKLRKIVGGAKEVIGSVKSGLTPSSETRKSSLLNYMFILCFFCSVVPALIETVMGERLKDGVDSSLIACRFGDTGKGMDTNIENSTSIRNIKDILQASVDKSTTKVVNRQQITIKQAYDIDNDAYLSALKIKQECPAPGIRGFLGFTIKKNAYGCIPDVNQNVDIEMSQISEDIIESVEEITNEVASELIAEASASSGSSDQETLNGFKDEVLDELIEETTELLLKIKDNSFDQTQNTDVVEIKIPLACSCDSKGSMIDSSFQLDLYAKEIREDIRKRILEKAIEKDIDLEFEGVKSKTFMEEFACIFQIIACTACILGVILLIKTVTQDNTKLQMKGDLSK
jgi:hypothetical protein